MLKLSKMQHQDTKQSQAKKAHFQGTKGYGAKVRGIGLCVRIEGELDPAANCWYEHVGFFQLPGLLEGGHS